MKPLSFKIAKPKDKMFLFQEDCELILYDKFHHHEEIQISYILEGSGSLIIGNSTNYYKKNDLFVIGANLPHAFRSNPNNNCKSHMLSIFFSPHSFGEDFFNLEELRLLKTFFKNSKNGFKLISNIDKLRQLFLKFHYNSGLNRFLLFFKVLNLISKSKSEVLSSSIHQQDHGDEEGKRMRNVIDYTLNNYQANISLDSVASIAAMTKNAFCNYFKKRTNKTYFTFLNELRIEHACMLLLESEESSIAEIAYKSGFKNISYFNRQFKVFKDKPPIEYKTEVLSA
ncbi:AraC family transcriptional regulator [Flavivirga spongiicola]|uniref:AraC family transcriptional regulator n=1 Tax=Flavivirga spongiicola TaxID=421621 RepID=A0ABU7XSM6_9FLAO|nr:AraC family transcriptional regulator [Flavivirga sp. MEBiC05379]MDO5978756.1 AraC family transcriptional regulator [Flavivirga sp. MEBiC05379]